MTKKDLLLTVCEANNISITSSYEASATLPGKNPRSVHGFVVNGTHFIDAKTKELYSVSDLSNIMNLDAYHD